MTWRAWMVRRGLVCSSSSKTRMSSFSLKAFCAQKATWRPSGSKTWKLAPRTFRNLRRIV